MSRQTLAAPARFEQELKRSRFVCRAAAIDSVESAMAFLRSVADSAATHNCWAFRIGSTYRSSDDGEPAGTAGRPILAAIDGQSLDGVMAVVTRWYGGIKLGAGGLARAYGGCAAECLRLAERRTVIEYCSARLRCNFSDLGEVHGLIGLFGASKQSEEFDSAGVQLQLNLPMHQFDDFAAALREHSRGRILLARVDACSGFEGLPTRTP